MSLKKFEKNDIFKNTIKTTPSYEFKIYKNKVLLNNSYEGYPKINYLNIPNSSSYYAYKIKSGDEFFRNTTEQEKNASMFGDTFIFKYPQSSSISVEFFSGSETITPNRKKIYALKNALESYKTISPYYSYNSEFGNKENIDATIVSIPSIFFGSSIQKGSVELEVIYSGSTILKLEDNKLNGELIQTTGSSGIGEVAGVVLYNHGFIILTGSWDTLQFNGFSWNNWAAGLSGYGSNDILESGSYQLKFKGLNYVENLMMLAHAEKGELNHSNNPTYVDYEDKSRYSIISSSVGFYEPDNLKIKNITKYAYDNFSGSLEKQTYISKIGIYDKNKNLIAVAKLAKPVRKSENRDFTFKLKLDI